MKNEKQILMDVIKGGTRQVDFTDMIKEQRSLLHKLQRQTDKPNKVEQAYFDLQKEKLDELENIVKRWIWEAFDDDEEITKKTMYWGEIQKHFSIKVLIEKKTGE